MVTAATGAHFASMEMHPRGMDVLELLGAVIDDDGRPSARAAGVALALRTLMGCTELRLGSDTAIPTFVMNNNDQWTMTGRCFWSRPCRVTPVLGARYFMTLLDERDGPGIPDPHSTCELVVSSSPPFLRFTMTLSCGIGRSRDELWPVGVSVAVVETQNPQQSTRASALVPRGEVIASASLRQLLQCFGGPLSILGQWLPKAVLDCTLRGRLESGCSAFEFRSASEETDPAPLQALKLPMPRAARVCVGADKVMLSLYFCFRFETNCILAVARYQRFGTNCVLAIARYLLQQRPFYDALFLFADVFDGLCQWRAPIIYACFSWWC